ncbi:MAG: inositol phosphorylceramide synthase [Actinobacteria bacterium]|nr:inositol phosphorylceramide synthase [Actinomycetota bacterium]
MASRVSATAAPGLPRGVIITAAGGLVGLVLAMEIAARFHGFAGPVEHFAWDLVGGPKRGRVIWVAFAMSLISLNKQQRIRAVAAAVVLDLAFFLARLPFDTRLTYGNGPFIVLLAIGFVAWTRWEGEERTTALKAVGLGLMLIMGTKMSDTWLRFTVEARPMVLDQFVQTADHALGNPSWVVGRALDASGPLVHRIIETVYIELPVGAMLVAIWQLRKGWPSHHIVRSFLLVALIGPIFYLLFPVVGPIFAFGPLGHGFAVDAAAWPHSVPWDLTPHAFRFDDITPRNCMPSLHTAWTVLIFVHTRRQPWAIRAFGTFWTTCTIIATLGLGWHYGVDLVAGVVFALTIESILRDPERGWDTTRWGLVLGGFALHAAMLLSFRFLAVQMAEYRFLSAVLLLGSMAVMILAFYRAFFVRAMPVDTGSAEQDETLPSLAGT